MTTGTLLLLTALGLCTSALAWTCSRVARLVGDAFAMMAGLRARVDDLHERLRRLEAPAARTAAVPDAEDGP